MQIKFKIQSTWLDGLNMSEICSSIYIYIYDVKQPRIHDHSVLVYILVYDIQKP